LANIFRAVGDSALKILSTVTVSAYKILSTVTDIAKKNVMLSLTVLQNVFPVVADSD
jgi:hypothetical protein